MGNEGRRRKRIQRMCDAKKSEEQWPHTGIKKKKEGETKDGVGESGDGTACKHTHMSETVYFFMFFFLFLYQLRQEK
jgi:hypothetical protein